MSQPWRSPSTGRPPSRLSGAGFPTTISADIGGWLLGHAAFVVPIGNHQVPTNLRVLYRLPTVVVVAYWRGVLAGPRGELWFAGHSRAAPEEMCAGSSCCVPVRRVWATLVLRAAAHRPRRA